MPPKVGPSKPSSDSLKKSNSPAAGGVTVTNPRKAVAAKLAAGLKKNVEDELRQKQQQQAAAFQQIQQQQAAAEAGGGAFQQQAAAGGGVFQRQGQGIGGINSSMAEAAFAPQPLGGGQAEVMQLLDDENMLDENMIRMIGGNIDIAFEEYNRRVWNVISPKNSSGLLPNLEKLIKKTSETVFMGTAPLGLPNPDMDNDNCSLVYPICLSVTRTDIVSLNYAWQLYTTHRDSRALPIPYLGTILATINPIVKGLTFGVSLLAYRYTLIWLTRRLSSLGGEVVVNFLTAFAQFMIDPLGSDYTAFRETHKVIFDILNAISGQIMSWEMLVVIIHQFCSRQNRLNQHLQGALPPAPVPPVQIMGWNMPFGDFFRDLRDINLNSALKLFRPDLACIGFDPTVPVMLAIGHVDTTLSSVLVRTSTRIQVWAEAAAARDEMYYDPFVKAHLKMKFKHTFDTEDGSVDSTLFKTVMIQERNKYVKNVIDGLMKNQKTYLQAKAILLDVYPQALDYCITSEALLPDNRSVTTARSTGSSVWTVLGSTASSLWRANQAVLEQRRVDDTFLSRLASTGIWFLKTAAETLIYETRGVATLPIMPEEPPIFAQRQTEEQRLAVRHAVHAVQVFDEWVDTVTSDAVIAMMQESEIGQTLGPSLTKRHVVNGVDRVKQFCRLTSEIKPLNDGTLLYVVNQQTVTGLTNLLRAINDEEHAQVFNGCLSAILELQRMIIDESNGQMLDDAVEAVLLAPENRGMRDAGAVMVEALGGPRQYQERSDAVDEKKREMQIIALDVNIPPAVVIEQSANPAVAAGGGAMAGIAAEDGDPQDTPTEFTDQVMRDIDAVLEARRNAAGGMDAGQDSMGEQGGGRSRSRKRSASKRTRRKAKQPSKKLKRKSRRYVRRRRSTRRKN